MEPVEYEVMYHREESYWWYVGLRDLVLPAIAGPDRGRDDLRMLDAGCGTGKLLESCGLTHAYGLEPSTEAFRFLRRRALPNLTQGSAGRMPYRDGAFDVVVSTDAICCVDAPGDLQALREIARVLRPGGLAVLNLPAFESLRAHHDAAVHTRQRYTRRGLRAMLAAAGLEGLTLTYRNTFFFPIAALRRVVQRWRSPSPERPESDLKPLPAVVDRLLLLPLLVENRLIRAGVNLPFGLSVYCVARKS
jgi:SAM-dependent methyltransferase